jgi:hypothetical protein
VIPEGPRIQGSKGSSENAKELQIFESLTKVLRTLFGEEPNIFIYRDEGEEN